MHANTEDHVLPVSIAAQINFDEFFNMRAFKNVLYRVPSCEECNGIGSNKVFQNIKDKRKFITGGS